MKLDMAGVLPMLAMPTHRDIPAATVRCLLETQHALLSHGMGSEMQMQVGGSLVHHARTKAAWQFLQSGCTHLFWVDSDIVWRSEDFLRLLALGTKLECVCAAYPTRGEPIRFFIGISEAQTYESNEFGCLPISASGLGFCCVQRGVIERLAEKAPKLLYPDVEDGPVPRIFRCDDDGTRARGEDMAFFADVRALGLQVWLDPKINLGHIGQKEYRGDLMLHLEQT